MSTDHILAGVALIQGIIILYLLWADWAHRRAWGHQVKLNKQTGKRLTDVEHEQTIMQIGRNKSRTVTLRGRDV